MYGILKFDVVEMNSSRSSKDTQLLLVIYFVELRSEQLSGNWNLH
jgi:hypothetical protein